MGLLFAPAGANSAPDVKLDPIKLKDVPLLDIKLQDVKPVDKNDGPKLDDILVKDLLDRFPLQLNPAQGTSRWELSLSESIDSSIQVGEDGTLYFATFDRNFHAVNPDGTTKWVIGVGKAQGTPAIGADGTIYVNTWDHRLVAIDPAGSVKWSFQRGGSERIGTGRRPFNNSPAIGANGTIYTGASDDLKLYAVNPDGTKKWEFKSGGVVYTPVVGSDGTIYFGSDDSRLYAVKPDGKKKWTSVLKKPVLHTAPAIGADGTIYIGTYDSALYAVNPFGTIKWSKDYAVTTTPAVGADGTLYVGANKRFLAVKSDGTIKWQLQGDVGMYTTPLIGADGMIYFTHRQACYAVYPSGRVKWKFDGVAVGTDLAMGIDGSVYAAGGSIGEKYLYALGTVAGSIVMNSSAIQLKAGESETLTATVLPDDAPNKRVKWSTGNAAIAVVDDEGKVTGVAPGKAKIIATSEDGGFTAASVVTVTAPSP